MTDKPTPPRNHMDSITKDAYLAELEAFALSMEYTVNKMDSKGDRCASCGTSPHSQHLDECKIGKVCEHIRRVREAHRLLGLG